MKRRVILNTVSPLHIGGRVQELTPLEIVVHNGYCYVIDETDIGRALMVQNKLDDFTNQVNKMERNFKLEVFLDRAKLLKEDFLSKSAAYRTKTSIKSTPRQVRPFVRDAYNCPYIPGSSIKGVLRTAVLYGILKKKKDENPGEFDRVFIESVDKKLNEYKKADKKQKNKLRGKIASELENDLLQRCKLPLPGERSRRPTPQQKDIMKCVKVSDSSSIDRDALDLETVQVISLSRTNETYLKTLLYVELMPPGTELSFNLTLDEDLLGDFKKENGDNLPFNSVNDILGCLEDFSRDIWEEEKNYWSSVYGPGSQVMKNFYNRQQGEMRIGWGSGLNGVGLLMLLPEEMRRKVRDTMFKSREKFDFPKSRRAVMEGDTPQMPLGWTRATYE